MIPAYIPLPYDNTFQQPVAIWNAYAPVFEPNDSIRRNINPLYDIPLTNVDRSLFYWPHVIDFYTGDTVSSDVFSIVSSM
jgi:hypothetical protein